MTNNPKVTIIIPAYNAEKFIHVCFESIEHLTYENIEVIFVDDGSKDNTFSMLQAFCKNHSYASCYTQENKGPSTARNVGLSHASGEYVCFFDSDDYLQPLLISECVRKIAENNVDVVVFSTKNVKEDFIYNFDSKLTNDEEDILFNNKGEILEQFMSLKIISPSPCNKMYKMSIIKKMEDFPKPWDELCYYGEDYDFNLKYLYLCDKALFFNEPFYLIRERKGSVVRSPFNERKLSELRNRIFLEKIDLNVFPTCKYYVKARICHNNLDMLVLMYSSSYNNKTVIKQIYNDYKENIKYCKKAKKLIFWLHHFLYARLLIFYFRFYKYLKD